MTSIFQIHTKSPKSKARTGKVYLAHGEIQTPCFMTIGTVGSVKSLSSWDLERLGSEIILGNTYHLWLRPGMEIMQKAGGLHNFINWNKPILTDSGGFQAFSLSKIRKFTDEGVFFKSQLDGSNRFLSPEISMQIQTMLGSDIALVLDECLEAEVGKSRAKSAMQRTFEWAKRSKTEFEKLKYIQLDSMHVSALEKLQAEISNHNEKTIKLAQNRSHVKKYGRPEIRVLPEFTERFQQFKTENGQVEKLGSLLTSQKQQTVSGFKNSQVLNTQDFRRYLFGIPQGAQFNDLRVESAKLTMELDFAGYSIGGVANGGEPEEVMYQQVLCQTEILEEHKPRHLLGVGTPKDIVEMVKRGIDMFDCVYPTRNARHGSILVWNDIERFEYETLKIESARFCKDFSPINTNSNLPELREYSKAYLCHLFRAKELLAFRLATLNNLEFYYELMAKIREKIEKGEI